MKKLPRRNYEINAIINKRNEKFIVIFTIAGKKFSIRLARRLQDWRGHGSDPTATGLTSGGKGE